MQRGNPIERSHGIEKKERKKFPGTAHLVTTADPPTRAPETNRLRHLFSKLFSFYLRAFLFHVRQANQRYIFFSLQTPPCFVPFSQKTQWRAGRLVTRDYFSRLRNKQTVAIYHGKVRVCVIEVTSLFSFLKKKENVEKNTKK